MPKGMLNKYNCDTCHKSIVTIDRDEGTTPFMILCEATKGCKGVMQSSWYTTGIGDNPTYEWFKPKSLSGYSPEMKDHIRRGGLDLRKIGTEGGPHA